MSQDETDTIKNASLIIEKFGGIRPMAAKVGAPVTTVQGWKKRDAIPSSRRDDIENAARENNIDLGGLLTGAAISDNASTSLHTDRDEKTGEAVSPLTPFLDLSKKDEEPDSVFYNDGNDKAPSGYAPKDDAPTASETPKITVEPLIQPLPHSFRSPSEPTHEDLMAEIAKTQKKAANTSFWTSVTIGLILTAGAAIVLWPSAKKIDSHEVQIATLNGKVGAVDKDVQAMNDNAGFLKELMPEDVRRKVAALKEEADTIKTDMQTVAAQAQDISKTVLASDAGSLSDRLSVLEAKLGDIEGGQSLKDLAARIRTLETSLGGQEQLGASMAELTKIVDSLDGQVNGIDRQLAEAQAKNESPLGQTLEGVSGNDLKAAALLIAFSQLRDSLNRNQPFEDDVVLLQKLVGEDEPELQTALTRLAPQAEKGGVLTREGLSEELKTMSGDIVFSSLKGEDVSVADKAKARLTQILNVKKDGELVGGTPVQRTVAKAQEQLDANDIEGAIATLNTLDGEAKVKATPLIEQAQATLTAEQVQTMLRQMIVANVGTGFPTAAGAAQGVMDKAGSAMQNMPAAAGEMTGAIKGMLPGGQEVVKDEESGFAILPAPKGFKGLSPGAQASPAQGTAGAAE